MINKRTIMINGLEVPIRSYEISIWNLLDGFITVLKNSNLDPKGTLLNPRMSISNDSVETITFDIPMYILSNGNYIENPIWYNTLNGNIISNMRKLKVIFNKNLPEERVFEFLIIKVTETHESNLLTCSITGESLAFNELGKIGYKISLDSELFIDEYAEWYKTGIGDEPVATLLYWLEHLMGIPKWPGENAADPLTWYYDINMDWSAYIDSLERSNKKNYEEAYVSSWTVQNNGECIPKVVENARERAFMMNEQESNIFNLTLTLAEKFHVFCRYEYGYDENYHIISRKIVFYNNFINEKEGLISFTYPYSSNKIEREMDSADTITKLYVKAVEDNTSSTGLISILDTEANKSGEDYLLNFDYMRDIGAIDEDSYLEVALYESQLHNINTSYNILQEGLMTALNDKNEVEARLTLAKTAVLQDIERLSNINDLLTALDIKDGQADGVLSVLEISPKVMVLSESTIGNYELVFSEKGVIYDTIKIYTGYDYTSRTFVGNLISKGQAIYDEFGNLSKLVGISTSSDVRTVYVIYDYLPALYYNNIRKTWERRLAQDKNDVNTYTNKLNALESTITSLTNQIKSKEQEKLDCINKFNRHMGSAIREGNWTPEDYKNCEDKYTDVLKLPIASGINSEGSTPYVSAIWDTELFDEEQDILYLPTITLDKVPYLCIDISDNLSYILDHLDELSIIYYDYTAVPEVHPYVPANATLLAIGASCQYGFVNSFNRIIPVIIITASAGMSDTQINFLRENGKLGIVNNVEGNITFTNLLDITSLLFTPSLSLAIVYPRIELNTLALNFSENNFIIKYNNVVLEEYNDYLILARDGKYYITLIPNTILKLGTLNADIGILYTLSRASTAIYLDAKLVLKENSIPKVSYNLESLVLNIEFMHTAYNSLNRIISINDALLKFENALGYISKLDLDLDHPWQDRFEVKNYRTKFEDLFTSIVASTEAMKKNSEMFSTLSSMFNSDGTFRSSTLLNSIAKADLHYAFNDGALTINELNGIWGVSESGVVAIRGGGIFTATQKDSDGNWIWNTGIIPSGINAELLTAGLLDTNKVVIYAGDEIALLLNDKGFYAYKSIFNDPALMEALTNNPTSEMADYIANNPYNNIDAKQYVVHNADGLFLIAEPGAFILNSDHNEFKSLTTTIKRVSITWDGLTLRDWNDNRTFYAEADTGDLVITGNLTALTLNAEGNNGKFYADSSRLGFFDENDLAIFYYNDNSITAASDLTITTGNALNLAAGSTLDIASSSTLSLAAGGAINIANTNGNNTVVLDQDGITILSGGTVAINSGGALTVNSSNMILDSNGTLKLGNNAASNPIFDFSNGSLSLTGDITATSLIANGTSGSFIANGSSLGFYSNNNPIFTIDSSGNISCASSLNIVSSGSLNINSSNFVLNSNGTLLLGSNANNNPIFDFSNGTLSLEGDIIATNITATTGLIAGWYITSSGFLNRNTNSTVSLNPATGEDTVLSAGNSFSVDGNGTVNAENIHITGGDIYIGGTSASPTFLVTNSGEVKAKNIILGDENGLNFKANSTGLGFYNSSSPQLTFTAGTISSKLSSLDFEASSIRFFTSAGDGVFIGTSAEFGSTAAITYGGHQVIVANDGIRLLGSSAGSSGIRVLSNGTLQLYGELRIELANSAKYVKLVNGIETTTSGRNKYVQWISFNGDTTEYRVVDPDYLSGETSSNAYSLADSKSRIRNIQTVTDPNNSNIKYVSQMTIDGTIYNFYTGI